MFRKTRIKIVTVIMSILAFLLVGTLCVIYISSYIEVYQRDQNMLERYAQAYSQNGVPTAEKPPQISKESEHPKGEQIFLLSTFYSVSFDNSDTSVMINNDGNTMYNDEQLTELAFSLAEKEKSNGTSGNLVYRIDIGEDYTLVTFMDNTLVSESITTLFRYTLIFGSIAVVILFFISLYLAKKIVQPLEENHRRQKQFISDAGHELKTPISVIGANAELLSREIGENQWLANIQFENSRMTALITQLLELARTENTAPNMSQVDFSRIVTGGTLTFESVAFEKGITLQYDVNDRILVHGSSEQLGQLVSIFVDNAIEHSSAGGTVAVALTTEHGMARFSVTNEGKEIPKEQQKLIFERFYQIDSSRTGEDHHYGLGLAIAKAIVTAHHGKIEVACKQDKVIFTAFVPYVDRF